MDSIWLKTKALQSKRYSTQTHYPASRVGLLQSLSSTFPTFYISISHLCKPALPGLHTCFELPHPETWTGFQLDYKVKGLDYKVKGIRLRLITLLAELAYYNLFLQHFQLFIFPSVICVSQLCLGFTLVLNCHIQKLGLDSSGL